MKRWSTVWMWRKWKIRDDIHLIILQAEIQTVTESVHRLSEEFKCEVFVFWTTPALFFGGLLKRLTVPRSPISGACFWMDTWRHKQHATVTNSMFPIAAESSMITIHRKKSILMECTIVETHVKQSFVSFSPWYKQILPDHWGSGHRGGSSPLGSFCPDQCLCSWSPQMCHDEERGNLNGLIISLGVRLQVKSVLTIKQLCSDLRPSHQRSGSWGLPGSCLLLYGVSTENEVAAAQSWSLSASCSPGSLLLTYWASLLPSGGAVLLCPMISFYWSAGTPVGSARGHQTICQWTDINLCVQH